MSSSEIVESNNDRDLISAGAKTSDAAVQATFRLGSRLGELPARVHGRASPSDAR